MKKEEVLNQKASKYAELIIKSTSSANSGHPSSALSLIHIVAGIFTLKRFNPSNPFDKKTNDAIILSEGHAVPVLYSAWAVEGMNYLINNESRQLTINDLEFLREINSPLDGHPNPNMIFSSNKTIRMPFSSATGALGQGLSIMAGIALADKFDKIKRNHFVICGDSEFREGQIDEALRFINTYKLPVTLFLNLNKWGQSAKTKELVKHNYKKELSAKDWKTIEINGHDAKQVIKALSKDHKRPTAILAHTIKGWNIKELQGDKHGRPLPKELLNKVLKKIPKTKIIIPQTKKEKIEIQENKILISLPTPKFSQKTSAREGYGKALLELGKNKNIIVLDAEVSNSTMTEYFKKKYPERYIECAIAEQNMMSVASGIASQGKTVFANSFARFLETCFSQWNISIQSKISLHVVGSHVGLTPHSDGPSQMGLADLNYALSFPNLVVVSPSDAVSAYYLTEECAKHQGPTYHRNYRPEANLLYDSKEKFFIGGSKLLKKGRDCLIVSHGFMVNIALEAAEELEKQNISVGVIDAYSLKPLDEKTIIAEAENCKKVITLEDNYLALGNLIASLIAGKNIKLKQLYVKKWPKSARKIEDLLKYCGISKEDIIGEIKSLTNSEQN